LSCDGLDAEPQRQHNYAVRAPTAFDLDQLKQINLQLGVDVGHVPTLVSSHHIIRLNSNMLKVVLLFHMIFDSRGLKNIHGERQPNHL